MSPRQPSRRSPSPSNRTRFAQQLRRLFGETASRDVVRRPTRPGLQVESLEDRRLMIVSAIDLDSGADVAALRVARGGAFDGVVAIDTNSTNTTAAAFTSSCTGALLESGRHILTAAHCVSENEAQIVDLGNPTAGTFQLGFRGQTTGNIPFNATPTNVEDALVALLNIGIGDVEVFDGPSAGTRDYKVSFRGALALQDHPQMTITPSLTAGSPAVTTDEDGGVFPNNVVEFELTRPGGGNVEIRLASTSLSIAAGWNGSTSAGNDLAILELAELAPVGAQRYGIFTGDAVGQTFTQVGYGQSGIGANGSNVASGVKRLGQNRYDTDQTAGIPGTNPANGTVLVSDFDNGNAANDALGAILGINNTGLGNNSEAFAAPGDSGGPGFIGNRIASVVSYGNRNNSPPDINGDVDETFGEFEVDTRVGAHEAFISNTVAGVFPFVVDMTNQPAGGDGTPDTIRVSMSGANIEVRINGTLLQAAPATDVTHLVVRGSNDDDNLVIDYAGGPVLLPIHFEGQGQGANGDSMTLTGGSVTDARYVFFNDHDGEIQLDGQMVSYVGLEPIDDNLNAVNRSFQFSSASETITLSDDPVAANNMSRIESTAGEMVDFVHPTNSLTILGGDGVDTVNLLPIDNASSIPSFVLDGESGNDVITGNTVTSGFNSVTIFGGLGDDAVVGTGLADTIHGDNGNDILVGGAGIDTIYGDEGDDRIGDPAARDTTANDPGNDRFFGGDGSDVFFWDPGDGSDTIEGGAGEADVLTFFGGAGAEIFNVFAKIGDPARAMLTRNTGNIVIDMAGIDQITVTGQAGADRYVIGSANDGDLGAVDAPTAPYVDPTATLTDLSTTEVRAVNIVEAADAADAVFVDGRPEDDRVLVSNESGTGAVRIAGLAYDVRIVGSDQADRLTVRGNEGDDSLKAADGVEDDIGITFAGGVGDDILSADAILIGGNGNDFLVGGVGNDQLFGNDGEDTMIGGGGQDTYDGGNDFDTILIQGTSGADSIDARQSAAGVLQYIVTDQTGTIVQSATVAGGTQDAITNVEEARIEAGNGADTIRVVVADELFNDANASLRFTIEGGDDAASDRLAIVDHTDAAVGALADLSILRQDRDLTSGTVEVGPANLESFLNVFSGIEFVQVVADTLAPGAPINIESAAIANRLVVFKDDGYEHNNDRNNATHLGAGTTVNLDPTIDPGPGLFGLPGDTDWYRVEALESGTIDFQINFEQVAAVGARPGLPGNGDLNINVFDSDGQAIAGFTTSDDNDDNERVRIPAVQGQIYYFQVVGDGAAINAYDVTAINLPAAVPFDLELQDNPINGTTNPPGQVVNSDTGRSSFDNHTYDTTPTILFRLDDGLFLNDLPGNQTAGTPFGDAAISIPFIAGPAVPAAPGYAIAVFDEGATAPAAGNGGGLNLRQPLGFATQIEPGLYSFTVPVANALREGSHFLTARVLMLDPATPLQNGWGDRSQSLEIVVDVTPPPAFFGLAADANDGLAPDPGVTPQPGTFVDNETNNRNPSFWGTAEANAIVRVYLDADADNIVDATDIFLGMTVAAPLDGANQYAGANGAPIGQWSVTSIVDLNDPAVLAALGVTAVDGQRHIILTAEDVAGNLSIAPQQALNIFLDTQGPQVAGVFLTESNLVALTAGNTLVFFNSVDPTLITATRPITGLLAGDTVVGIDVRPADQVLYAVVDGAATDRIYSINTLNGAATLVSTLSVNLNGTTFGVDFNPFADRLRIVSDTDQNLRVVVGTGVAVADGALNPGNPNVVAAAYTNNQAGAGFTTLYTIDSTTDNLNLQDPPNAGTQIVVGALGVDATAISGFDILEGTNRGVAALTVGGVTSLYDINLTTGAATLAAGFNSTIGDGTTVIGSLTGLPAYDVFGLKPGNAFQGPTPAVRSLSIALQDLPARTALFLDPAANPFVVLNPGHYVLRGDHNGIIPIAGIELTRVPERAGQAALGTVTLTFTNPLPDDRYTLSLSDAIVDNVGNRLDGETDASQPRGPQFPSGDGQPGGSFVARFTVDSRPELASISQGVVYADINGNFVFDPEGKDNDFTNRDFVLQIGTLTDSHFAGNFSPTAASVASGYDKLGVYGFFGNAYSFLIDTNDNGVGDTAAPMFYQVNGIAVAGEFDGIAANGDEIGLFDGSFWYVDRNHSNSIDNGERIAANYNGLPVVGDFDGDNDDDFAVYNNDTNTFTFDMNPAGAGTLPDGNADSTWAIRDDLLRFSGPSGFTDRPISGDFNLDGVDDLGLWVMGRQGQVSRDAAEVFLWISDRAAALPQDSFDAFSPEPLGNDLYLQFGDEVALPVFGNFDPPVQGEDNSLTGSLTNLQNPFDVNQDGDLAPLDALLVINSLNRGDTTATRGPDALRMMASGAPGVDVNGDGQVQPVDALLVVNALNRQNGGSAEPTFNADSVDAAFGDDAFACLFDGELTAKKRRRS